MTKPQFSTALPSCTEGLCYPIPFTNVDVIKQIAQAAEQFGYHSVWPNDHLSTQQYVSAAFDTSPNYFDPFICLAYAASGTTRLKLGTAITVLPMREPTTLAKTVMTLDHFTGGRMILGVGVGAYREEFEAVAPRLARAGAHRGDMLAESVQALQTLFSEHPASHNGKYWEFQDVEMFPKPVQDPLPIWIGGNSRASAVRAGRMADGWLPAVLPIDQLREFVGIVHAEAEQAGRNPARIEIAPQFVGQVGRTMEEAVNTFRQSQMYHHLVSLKKSTLKNQDLSKVEEFNLIGTPDVILEKVARYVEAGVTHFCSVVFSTNTVEETLEQMQWFAEEVIAPAQA